MEFVWFVAGWFEGRWSRRSPKITKRQCRRDVFAANLATRIRIRPFSKHSLLVVVVVVVDFLGETSVIDARRIAGHRLARQYTDPRPPACVEATARDGV